MERKYNMKTWKRIHITVPIELEKEIRKYADKNNLFISQSIRKLIENGLDNIEMKKQLEIYNSLMNKIFSRQLYIRDLLEQFYTDMEIEKLLNPKNNKALQQFKLEKQKDKFND